jgi:hypothetical protein
MNASFVGSTNSVRSFETSAEALDHSALVMGYRLLKWSADFKTVEQVPDAEVSKYLADTVAAPMPMAVDFWLTDAGKTCPNPSQLEEVARVKQLSAVWQDFAVGQFYSFNQKYVLFRNPEVETKSFQIVSRWGYTFPAYDGTLVINGIALPVRPDHRPDGLFPIKGVKLGADPASYSLGQQLTADSTRYHELVAQFGQNDQRVRAEGEKVDHGVNAYWKYALGRALLSGSCIRAKTGRLTWHYIKSMILQSQKLAGQPLEARKHLFEQMETNKEKKQDYQQAKDAGFPAPAAPSTDAQFPTYGTDNGFLTLSDLRKVPVGTRVNIMANRRGTGVYAPIYWPGSTEEQDAFLSMCKKDRAIWVVTQ